MSFAPELSTGEFASLQEVAKGFDQTPIPEADALRLLELHLIYKLLGMLRMTGAGRARIASGNPV
jgi:hypothetical protein